MLPGKSRGTDWNAVLLAAGGGALAGIALSTALRQLKPLDKTVTSPITPVFSVGEEQFRRSMDSILRAPMLPGNSVETLINGDRIFPAMLESINRAERTITFETFVYWEGKIGRSFAKALADRSRSGVRCRVLLDWFGSNRMDAQSLRLMQNAGVRIDRFHRNLWRLDRLNHRTHRKLLVLDGKVGYIGGVGIADQWSGNAQDKEHWRDNHYLVQGPVVAQLQSAFVDNWLKSQHEVLYGPQHFPPLPRTGVLDCHIYQSSPDEGSESMRLMMLLALSAARKSVCIATAYFVPDDLTIAALKETRSRGVEVEVIVPGPNIDYRIVRHASRAQWGKLLDSGVRIFEYLPTMYHCKAIIVDDLWVSIGSANFDNRSFRLNDEANLNVLSAQFAREQSVWFEKDKENCRPVSLKRWRARGLGQKVLDHAADVVGRQL